MKKGDPIENIIHSSGEDLLVSYRTGLKVLIKNNKVEKIYNNGGDGYNEINWQRMEWQAQEKAAEIAANEKTLKTFHIKAASKHARQLLATAKEGKHDK